MVIKLLLPFSGFESQFHILIFIESYAEALLPLVNEYIPLPEKKGVKRIVHTGLRTIGKTNILLGQTKVPNAFFCGNCNKIVGVFDITNNIDD